MQSTDANGACRVIGKGHGASEARCERGRERLAKQYVRGCDATHVRVNALSQIVHLSTEVACVVQDVHGISHSFEIPRGKYANTRIQLRTSPPPTIVSQDSTVIATSFAIRRRFFRLVPKTIARHEISCSPKWYASMPRPCKDSTRRPRIEMIARYSTLRNQTFISNTP